MAIWKSFYNLLFIIIYNSIFYTIYFSSTITTTDHSTTTPAPSTTSTTTTSTTTTNSNLLNYDQLDWPLICSTGANQSPINFPSQTDSQSLYNKEKKFEIIDFSYNILNRKPLQIYQSSTFMVNATGMGHVIVKKNGYTYHYDTSDIHFHFPAEHSIAGHVSDIELQIVHIKNSDSFKSLNGNTTITDPDLKFKYMYIGQILHASGTVDNKIIKSFKIDRDGPVSKLDLSTYVPKNKPYYFYQGSLTTPPCSENVNWVVNPTVEVISKAQMLSFLTWMTQVYGLTGNHKNLNSDSHKLMKVYYQYYPLVINTTTTQAQMMYINLIRLLLAIFILIL